MRIAFLAALLLLGCTPPPGEPTTFELRAVAENPSETTIELPESPAMADAPGAKLLVEKDVLMDGSALNSASQSFGQNGWEIRLELTRSGAVELGRVTTERLNKRVAIIVDGTVIAAPFIREPIRGGSVVISGKFSEQESRALAEKLDWAAKRKP